MQLNIKYQIEVQIRECVITQDHYQFLADGRPYISEPITDFHAPYAFCENDTRALTERVKRHFAAMHDAEPEELGWEPCKANPDAIRSQQLIRKNGGSKLTPVELEAYKHATRPRAARTKRA